MPNWLAWTFTFGFVNFAWVFFRAKNLDDAKRVLYGMVDFSSAFGGSVESIPVSDIAWAGVLADLLLTILPTTLVGQLPVSLAIFAAFVMIAQKNSIELASGIIGIKKTIFGAIIFVAGMYFTLAATSTVFLYFNF